MTLDQPSSVVVVFVLLWSPETSWVRNYRPCPRKEGHWAWRRATLIRFVIPSIAKPPFAILSIILYNRLDKNNKRIILLISPPTAGIHRRRCIRSLPSVVVMEYGIGPCVAETIRTVVQSAPAPNKTTNCCAGTLYRHRPPFTENV